MMMDTFSFAPHAVCLRFNAPLIATLTLSDLVIGLSYLSIPACLIYLAWFKRNTVPSRFQKYLWVYGIFIILCGLGHFIDIVTMWQPFYIMKAYNNVLIAVASTTTAVITVKEMPRNLALLALIENQDKNATQ